jgi:hypothetical protein
MRWEGIVGLCVLTSAISTGLTQQFTAPARAAAPIVRATYQGIGVGVNNNVAVIWLLGSDGSLRICSRAATGTVADAPTCSPEVVPLLRAYPEINPLEPQQWACGRVRRFS